MPARLHDLIPTGRFGPEPTGVPVSQQTRVCWGVRESEPIILIGVLIGVHSG